MADDTHPIELELIVSAPTDGQSFEAILGDAPHVIETVKFEHGRWRVYRGTVPSPYNTALGMEVWHVLADGVYPTHWIKGTIGKHERVSATAPASENTDREGK